MYSYTSFSLQNGRFVVAGLGEIAENREKAVSTVGNNIFPLIYPDGDCEIYKILRVQHKESH